MKYLVIVRSADSVDGRQLQSHEGELKMRALGQRLLPLLEDLDSWRVAVRHAPQRHAYGSTKFLVQGLRMKEHSETAWSTLGQDDDLKVPELLLKEIKSRLAYNTDVLILVVGEKLSGLISAMFFRELGIVRDDAWTGVLDPGQARIFYNKFKESLEVSSDDPPRFVATWIRRLG